MVIRIRLGVFEIQCPEVDDGDVDVGVERGDGHSGGGWVLPECN